MVHEFHRWSTIFKKFLKARIRWRGASVAIADIRGPRGQVPVHPETRRNAAVRLKIGKPAGWRPIF